MKITLRSLIYVLILLVLVACGSESSDSDEGSSDSSSNIDPNKPTIIIGYNSWEASEINAFVAKTILENELGYPVETIAVNEAEQWDVISAGTAHALLEVWPSGHQASFEEYIEQNGTVEFGGELGPVGQISWYVPTYVVQQFPELASWEGFQNPENIVLFQTEASGDAGQFLAGDPGWTEYEDEIIPNLGLNLEVVRVEGDNPESAIIDEIEAADKTQSPLLFYFWTPHWIHAVYDLEQVSLPPYSEECFTAEEGVACEYPEDRFYKIFWPELSEYAPDAHTFLSNFSYTNRDQIAMMAAVQLEDRSIEDVAREWVNQNESTWQAWLPE